MRLGPCTRPLAFGAAVLIAGLGCERHPGEAQPRAPSAAGLAGAGADEAAIAETIAELGRSYAEVGGTCDELGHMFGKVLERGAPAFQRVGMHRSQLGPHERAEFDAQHQRRYWRARIVP